MYPNCPRSAEILFAAADATWRAEAARLLGKSPDDPQLAHHPGAQGHPHSFLAIAYEVRQWALAEWEKRRSELIEAA